MSASALYRAMGLKGYDVIYEWDNANEIGVAVELPRHRWKCAKCQSRRVTLHEWCDRQWRGIPIGQTPTRIVMSVPRVLCADCGARSRLKVKFDDPRFRHSVAFEKYAASLLKYMTPNDLAIHLDISWDTAAAIDKRRLESLPRPSLRTIKHIAIDEIYAGKLHKFMTLVLDLESGAVLFAGPGRGASALDPFIEKLKKAKAKIKAVAIDMAGGYIAAVEKHWPNATLVFDHFHVIKLMNDKLTQLRREEYNALVEKQDQSVLKGVRWLLLRGEETLVNPKGKPSLIKQRQEEYVRLQKVLELNKPLATAYIFKEELRLLWSQDDKQSAQAYLVSWCHRADASGIKVLQTMANTLLKHSRGILAWYDIPISTGPLEGTNNKIKLMQRRAYGYRNKAHFILRIETLHHTKLKLIG